VTIKTVALALTALAASACASAPKTPATPPATFDDKLAWILRLEDQRVLHDPAPSAAPASRPDLIRLLSDPEGRVRRRAALAIGRTGMPAGVAPLVKALGDPDVDMRQTAAFALGVLGDNAAAAPLAAALQDADHAVRGRAAEALGLLDAKAHAAAIGELVSGYVRAGVLASIAPDDQTYPMAPEIEAARLGIYALARLKAYDPLASALLDANGQPVSTWWPIAYAFRRVEDSRAAQPMRALLRVQGQYTRAFAARGLGVVKAKDAVPDLLSIAADVVRQPAPAVEAIRSLGEIGDRAAAPVLRKVLAIPKLDSGVRAEAVKALGSTATPEEEGEFLLDLLSDSVPAVRANAFRALATVDRERLLLALSGLEPDRHWRVRAAIAEALGNLPGEQAIPLLIPFAADDDLRAVPAALSALARLKAPEAEQILLEKLKSDDAVVRAAAAEALGEVCPASAAEPLAAAYQFGTRDAGYVARTAVLDALAVCDRQAALPVAKTALRDRDWAVRLRAARLVKEVEPQFDAISAIRPAPTQWTQEAYRAPSVVSPRYSTHVYFDTDHGTFQVELAVLDAPLTVHNFVSLARKGFFDGLSVHRVVPNFVIQDGDPRGDGAGGSSPTIRDEISTRPYLRGTMGMALAGADTGGSQYFITHSPQPHLDARYTVFGQVIAGMEVVDRLTQWDVVRRVRVWDGEP
jgi:HEAT repeat protein/cyclophilin family peptidyl-prolyl cis-trans isomerase